MNLKELSQLLGLSQTTVSRALNGYPEVAESTRARVKAAAQEHGYRPNTRARGLATGRAMAVAQVIPADWLGELANPVLAEVVTGATEAFAAAGYETLLNPMPDSAVDTAYRDLAARGAVDGVLLHLPRIDDPQIAALEATRLPFVVHGAPPDGDARHGWVGVDTEAAARQSTRVLFREGHQRIALINGPETLVASAARLRGYHAVVRRRNLDTAPELTCHTDMTETAGHAAAAALLDSPTPPSAMLIATMAQAMGAARACAERGRSVGNDIALVAHDDTVRMLGGDTAPPRFPGTRASAHAAGRSAAEMLLRRIAAPDSPAEGLKIPCEFVSAATSPAAGS